MQSQREHIRFDTPRIATIPGPKGSASPETQSRESLSDEYVNARVYHDALSPQARPQCLGVEGKGEEWNMGKR
eukprot:2006276-Pyramimonas_sp.AAC.1